MMTASPIVSRYSVLHQEALRLEVHRDRLAATCQPGDAIARRSTRVWSAAASLLMSLSSKAATGRRSVDPAASGAL